MTRESQPSYREILDERGPSLEEILEEVWPTRRAMTFELADETARKKKPGKVMPCKAKQQAG